MMQSLLENYFRRINILFVIYRYVSLLCSDSLFHGGEVKKMMMMMMICNVARVATSLLKCDYDTPNSDTCNADVRVSTVCSR